MVGQALVLEGEDYLIDTVLRVPMEAAGFRYQHFHPFGLDGGHLYAWIEGAPYCGRSHTDAALSFHTAEQAATRLRRNLAAVVLAAADSYRALDEQTYYADNLRTLERAPTCAGGRHGRAAGSAATSGNGGRHAGTSPRRSTRAGRSWTWAARTAC